MSTTFCEKCKLEHPGQPCDFKDGECRETPNADTHSYSDLGGFEPYCPRTKTGYDLRLAGRERPRRKEIMKTTMLPGCCGLKTIHQIGCLGRVDAFSTREAEAFDEMVKVGTAQDGMWASYGKAPDTIAIITDSPRYNKPAEFEK